MMLEPNGVQMRTEKRSRCPTMMFGSLRHLGLGDEVLAHLQENYWEGISSRLAASSTAKQERPGEQQRKRAGPLRRGGAAEGQDVVGCKVFL